MERGGQGTRSHRRVGAAVGLATPHVTVEFVFGRVIWIVLDSVGIGEMPDAAQYGDAGSDTLGNIARIRGLNVPNLARLGLGHIKPLTGIALSDTPAAYGKC